MRLLDHRLKVEKALRDYRARLSPGVYFFVGDVRDGELRGIEEIVIRQDAMAGGDDSDGVVFGFFERGREAQQQMVHHVQATSPEFMQKLQEYLAERVRPE